jgi:thymidylate synthase
MRLFKDFKQGMNEIQRDLKEMGTRHVTQTMQDKDVSGDESMTTLELINYGYTILNPKVSEIPGIHKDWCLEEWEERRRGIYIGHRINPGSAWQLRPEIWQEFLHDSEFSYTYPERLAKSEQVLNVIDRLKRDPGSRQMFITVWNHEDSYKFGKERVPCTLGYVLQHREGKLNITSLMRSCDLFTHYPNDCYLTVRLMGYIAMKADLEPGTFSHFINSFHVYEKDVKNVF